MITATKTWITHLHLCFVFDLSGHVHTKKVSFFFLSLTAQSTDAVMFIKQTAWKPRVAEVAQTVLFCYLETVT